MHVHVMKDGREAKVWMQSISVEWNRGFREHEINEIVKILENNRQIGENAWDERA
jgi:ribosome-binding factor A